jgi:hypothetical protein
MELSTKHCPKCGQVKAAAEFSKNRRRKDGLNCYCKACSSAYHAHYAGTEAGKAKIQARSAAWYLAHREQNHRRTNVWRQQHREQGRIYSKKWRDANRSRRQAYEVQYHAANKEARRTKSRKYQKEHLAKYAEYNARRLARHYGVATEKVDYEAIVKRDSHTCHICGQQVTKNEISFDHVVPMSRGGPHSPQNVKLSHLACNRKKGSSL